MKGKLSNTKIIKTLFYAFTLMLLASCGQKKNQLSSQERNEGWVLLFNGETMNGWHVFNKGDIASAWAVDSGNLVCNPHTKNVKHGDLVTDKVYENFDLVFDWKISKAGNSGVFVNVQERPELVTTFSTGPEYQLLDDQNMDPDYLNNLSHKAASIFGVVPNNSKSVPKPGEWNHSRILQQNGKLTFWLNDTLTVQVDLNSAGWKEVVAASPMSHYPEFGTAVKGRIALQDWTNGIAFRNMKIKEMK